MRLKLFLIILGFVMLAIAITFAIYISYEPPLSPADLETCKIIQQPEKGTINIVFFSSKENAEKYTKSLLDISPLDENKEQFNIYYINDFVPNCEIYKGMALLCYNRELIKKASSCPNDYIIVIKDEGSSIRSSAYMNVMSINYKNHLTVLAHEFGHVFANLAEEYTPAKIPRGSENCVSTCEKFEGETNGCFQGCSEANYYRSIDRGIMKTLTSKNYGIFDKNIILEKINKELMLSPKFTGNAIKILDCSEEEYYLIKGLYNTGEVFIQDKTIERGCLGKNGVGGLEYNLILKDDTAFQKEEFNPELIFTDIQGEIEIDGETYESDKEFFLKIPIIENSKTLEISKEDKLITEINLQDLGSRPCKK
jgi:hypothetical protein